MRELSIGRVGTELEEFSEKRGPSAAGVWEAIAVVVTAFPGKFPQNTQKNWADEMQRMEVTDGDMMSAAHTLRREPQAPTIHAFRTLAKVERERREAVMPDNDPSYREFSAWYRAQGYGQGWSCRHNDGGICMSCDRRNR